MYLGLRIVRGIVGFIALWQVLSLLPVITWIATPGSITSSMVLVVSVKAILLVLFAATYFAMRDLINKLHAKTGSRHPVLYSQWSL
jgi:hypothetical protein